MWREDLCYKEDEEDERLRNPKRISGELRNP